MTSSTSTRSSTRSSTDRSGAVAIGEAAPPFAGRTAEGTTLALKDFAGRILALYFYPRDHTPGCTREACDFRDAHPELARIGVAVVGVSRDDEASHRRFVARHALPFPLIADTEGAICRAYGVLREKSLYGRRVLGIERSTFLIDRGGIVRAVWRRVRVPGHVGQVLAAAAALA
ncbi:MAG: peroxiredoxin [Xanthomonadales bacterium]|nr:peroxiredoxin [Xanthomonadales bacterium]